MQSETSDVTPSTAAWLTGRNVRVVFHSGPMALSTRKVVILETFFLANHLG